MPNSLVNRRKPISSLLSKLPAYSEISYLDLKFDMYCSTTFEDISMVLKYCYVQNLLRPITSYQYIQSFLQKHYFYTSNNIDFLLRYKASKYPVHSLEDHVQSCEIEIMPKLGIRFRVYRWISQEWTVDERFEISGRAPICYLMEYNSKMYILYTDVMTCIDQYDPITGRRRFDEITMSYLMHAEQILMYNTVKTLEFTPQKNRNEGKKEKNRKLAVKMIIQEETVETTKDTDLSLGNSGNSELFSGFDKYNTPRDNELVLETKKEVELNSLDFDETDEPSVLKLVSCRYNRRDRYFKEGCKKAMTILLSKYISPKVLSTSGSVVFESEISIESSSSPQIPKSLFVRSTAAGGYWSVSSYSNLSDSISKLKLVKSDSSNSSLWETNSVAILESLGEELDEDIEDGKCSENLGSTEETPSKVKRKECGSDCIII